MRKPALLFAVAALAVLGIVATALAVTNTYTVTGSVSPTAAGSTKKPVPVGIKFNYTVGEVDNQRPAPVDKYKIKFDGLFVNTDAFKGCTAQAINAAGSDAPCPAAAKMGSGSISAIIGASNDPSQNSLKCYLAMTFYNSRKNHAALYIKGTQNAPAGRNCPAEISQAIDAAFVRSSTGTTLQFVVQKSLLHPINGFDSSVVNVQSTILRKTAKVKGKKVGYYQAQGGCKKGKRAITVTFHQEGGLNRKAQNFAKCK